MEGDNGGKSMLCNRYVGCGCCCCCIVLLFVVVNFVLKGFITNSGIAGFIELAPEWIYENCRAEDHFTIEESANIFWTPGCGSFVPVAERHECGAPCYPDALWEGYHAFSQKHGGKVVSYPNRRNDTVEDLKIRGWWLPANSERTGSPPPRIVVQHGFTSNSNKYRQLFAAYVLRSLGFDVLVTSFRDHCYSDNSTAHINEWGHAYPFDLLGAWDYAVDDPDGIFGGKLDASLVGILGFSKGAFTTLNAFGLEPRVPAVWVDSPPIAPEKVFTSGLHDELSKMGLGFMTNWYAPGAWDNLEAYAMEKGIDLEDNLPRTLLKHGPDTKRPIMWAHTKEDLTVPFANGEDLEALLATMEEKYALQKLINEEGCTTNTHFMNHCVDILLRPELYKEKLCSFWQSVFKLESTFCTASTVIDAATVIDATPATPEDTRTVLL